jgi:hypothetical protein
MLTEQIGPLQFSSLFTNKVLLRSGDPYGVRSSVSALAGFDEQKWFHLAG